jgi:hypothetical protein
MSQTIGYARIGTGEMREEWAVHSDDGTIYRVEPPTKEKAEHEAALLQRGVPGDPEMTPEPGAAPAYRHVMIAPDGRTAATGWRWTLGWKP